MEKYYFEQTDLKFLTVLVVIVLLIPVAAILCLSILSPMAGEGFLIFIAIGAPILVFILNKRKLTKQVEACVDDTSVSFDFGDYTEQIDFENLKSYQIEDYNGITLRLQILNRKKIELTASSGFSDLSQMKIFCKALEQKIHLSNKNNLSNVTRIASAFETKWMLPLLIILTVIISIILINSFSKEKLFTVSFYTSITGLAGLWLTWYRARQKKQMHSLDIRNS